MATCKDCIHIKVCIERVTELYGKKVQYNSPIVIGDSDLCPYFMDKSQFVKQKTTLWCKHTPDRDVMQKFQELGIGKGMSEDSIFCTCANCGVWGSPIYKYCPNCGAKAKKENNNETQKD